MKEIYLDYAAATPIAAEVQEEITHAMRLTANPSSFHDAARIVAQKLRQARIRVARFLSARPEEIVFTSSGSESNNLALVGSFFRNFSRACNEILATPIEHPSVLESLKYLTHRGAKVKLLSVDRNGFVRVEDVASALTPRTLLVSVMHGNNEIGTIQPVGRIGKIIKAFRDKKHSRFPFFHSDACQSAGYLKLNVNALGVDLLTLNSTKLYGPRGAAVLYIRRGVELEPLIHGGGQEMGLRAGTENMPAILGLARALDLVFPEELKRITELRDYFVGQIQEKLPEVRINGPLGKERLPHNVHVSIPGLESEQLLLELDKYGIRAGSGSACTSYGVEPSHVLKAVGIKKPYLDGVLRFSLGRQTTKRDIGKVMEVLPKIMGDLRKRYKKVLSK